MRLGELYYIVVISGIIIIGSMLLGSREKVERGMIWLIGGGLLIGGVISIGGGVGDIIGYIKGVVYIGGGLCIISSIEKLKREERSMEYVWIVMMVVFGMGLMVGAKELMGMYLALEMQALGLYVLATYKKESGYGTEAGMKYFVIGAFASGLMLMGSAQIYGGLGTINLEEIGRVVGGEWGELERSVKIGVIMLSAGLLFKLGAVPLHMWVPDVYEGAPIVSTQLFAVVPKIAIIGVVVRLCNATGMTEMLGVVAGGSMIVGAIGGLYQRRVKRFLAYSGIGHVGYMLMGISSGSEEGMQGGWVYIIMYMIMTMSIWVIVQRSGVVYIEELWKIGRGNGYMGLGVGVIVLSMAGVPPLGGFFAKMYVFMGALAGGKYILGLIGGITSVISGYYYLRWIKVMYFEKGKETYGEQSEVVRGVGMERITSLIVGGCIVVIVGYGMSQGVLVEMGYSAALQSVLV